MNVDFSDFSNLDDSAVIKFYSLTGSPSRDDLEPLVAIIRELLAQWKADGKIRNGSVSLLVNGGFLAVAFEPTAGDISGCTKDSLTHILQDFEKRLSISIINSPRFSVLSGGKVEHMSQKDFRAKRQAGEINDTTIVFDHLIQNLGQAKNGGFEKTVNNSWYAPVGG